MRLRGLTVVVFVLAALLPAAAGAQDGATLPDSVADALGATADEIAALEPNPAWDGLGLFSDDALRVIEAATVDRPAITYGFGDDPNGAPLFVPDGGTPIGAGSMFWHMPDEWVPPAPGWGGDMAFAQTPGSQLQPQDPFLLLWMEFDNAYDFSSTRQVNEGFPLAVPGLPVWNSTFAGDTWEGANVIPNAIYDSGVLTLDVKQFQPPQNFPLIDLAAFYYRSGNIMAMGVAADGLLALADTATDVSAAGDGSTQSLLHTGESSSVLAHEFESALDEIMFELYWFGWSHITENGQFTPGFIAYLVETYGPIQAAIALDTTVRLFGPPPTSSTASTTSQGASTPDPVPEEPTDTPADPPSAPPTDAPSDGGISLWPLILILIGFVMLLFGGWLWWAPLSDKKDDKDDEGESDEEEPDDEDDEGPRDTPVATPMGEVVEGSDTCDWYMIVRSKKGHETVVREPKGHRCCGVELEIESFVTDQSPELDERHGASYGASSYRQLNRALSEADTDRRLEEAEITGVHGIDITTAEQVKKSTVDIQGLSVDLEARARYVQSSRSFSGFVPRDKIEGDYDPDTLWPEEMVKSLEKDGFPMAPHSTPPGASKAEVKAALLGSTHIEIDIHRYCPPEHFGRDDQSTHCVGKSSIVFGNGNRCVFHPAVCQNVINSSTGGATWLTDELEYDVDETAFERKTEGKAATVKGEIDLKLPEYSKSFAALGGSFTAKAQMVKAENHNATPDPITFTGNRDLDHHEEHIDIRVHDAVFATGGFTPAGVVGDAVSGESMAAWGTVRTRHHLKIDSEAEHARSHEESECKLPTCKRRKCACAPKFSLEFHETPQAIYGYKDFKAHATLTVDGKSFYFSRVDAAGHWTMASATLVRQMQHNL